MSSQRTDSIWEMENPIGKTSSKSEDLWFIITILCVIIVIGTVIIIGGGDFLSKTVGNTLIFISDTITDWGITVLKIFNGAIHDITRFLLPVKDSGANVTSSSPPSSPATTTPTTPSSPSSPLQQAQVMPVSTPMSLTPPDQKTNPVPATTALDASSSWCFVGESNNKRSCVAVNDPQKCLSGKVFPTLENCWIAK